MIRYRVDRGDSNFEIGSAQHEWSIVDGHYRLTSVVETTGLVWLFKAIRIEMESRGLMTAAIEGARVMGAESLFLEVAVDNPAAIGLYRQLGFNEAGLRRGYYRRKAGGPVDALVMRLSLNS